MTTNNEFALLHLVPSITRARGFRLYTGAAQNKGRLVDLWQNGGAAVLGHTPPSLLKELKNTASRGLYFPFPHFLEGRFIKALSRFFPGRDFRLYCAPPPETQALVEKGVAALWRPFLEPCLKEDAPPILIPVIPGIQGWRNGLPLGLCVFAVTSDFEKAADLPPGDFLSPILLAAAARGLYDLIAATPERSKLSYSRIAKVLKKSPWQRQGIYLTLRKPAPDNWAELFSRFLEAGFLLPPVPYHPAILPGVLSSGEEAKLALLLN